MPGRDATPRGELWLYLFAAVVYIGVGFVAKEVFAWWSYGAIWLVALVWLGPLVFRRVRARRSKERDDAAGPSGRAHEADRR